MELDFIDQNDGLALKRVIHMWVGDGHTTGQIADHGEGTFLAVRELVHNQLLSVFLYDHS